MRYWKYFTHVIIVFQLIAIVVFVASARAAIIATPSASAISVAQPPATIIRADPYNSYPQYSFGYSVADGLTGNKWKFNYIKIFNI